MKPEETIDFNIRWTWHKIARFYNNEAAKYGSSMSVGYILLNIDVEKGTPSTKLGPKMGMEPRSLTRILKSMEDKGLICRKSDREDGRMVSIFLTELGKKTREISKDAVIKFNLAVQEKIPVSKLNIFYEVIAELNNILENKNLLNGEENEAKTISNVNHSSTKSDMILNDIVKRQIVSRITGKFKVRDIIVFGSYAWGNPHKDSDIDLLIVLNEKGFTKTYTERANKRIAVSKAIHDLKKQMPFDILVYTKDEWKKLIEINSYFIRNINQNGIRLI